MDLICQVSEDDGFICRLIICTVYFSETKQHDIVHKAFFLVWDSYGQVVYKQLAFALSDDLGVESDTSG